MQCPICWANTIGFIGGDCRCGDSEQVPQDAVTVDGVPVTHDGTVVTHAE